MPSPPQLTFTSTKDQDRQISVDVSKDGSEPKQVLTTVTLFPLFLQVVFYVTPLHFTSISFLKG